MKKLKKLKLNTLSNQNLENKEMNALKGGVVCTCSCLYEGQSGGSSTTDNALANFNLGGWSSPGGDNCTVVDGYDAFGNPGILYQTYS